MNDSIIELIDVDDTLHTSSPRPHRPRPTNGLPETPLSPIHRSNYDELLDLNPTTPRTVPLNRAHNLSFDADTSMSGYESTGSYSTRSFINVSSDGEREHRPESVASEFINRPPSPINRSAASLSDAESEEPAGLHPFIPFMTPEEAEALRQDYNSGDSDFAGAAPMRGAPRRRRRPRNDDTRSTVPYGQLPPLTAYPDPVPRTIYDLPEFQHLAPPTTQNPPQAPIRIELGMFFQDAGLWQPPTSVCPNCNFPQTGNIAQPRQRQDH